MRYFDNIEDFLMTLATKAAPWLTPLVPAFFIGRAVGVHLETPGWVAVVAAASTEAVGVMAAKRALEAWDWNEQHTRKTDPVAPVALSVWLAVGYLFAGILLSVGLEVWGEILAPFAPAVFFLLALIAYLSLALSWQQARWKRNLEAEQQERSEARNWGGQVTELEAELEQLKTVAITEQERNLKRIAELEAELAEAVQVAFDWRKLAQDSRNVPLISANSGGSDDRARLYLEAAHRESREPTGTELAEHLGVSGSYARKLKRAMWADVTGTSNANGAGQEVGE